MNEDCRRGISMEIAAFSPVMWFHVKSCMAVHAKRWEFQYVGPLQRSKLRSRHPHGHPLEVIEKKLHLLDRSSKTDTLIYTYTRIAYPCSKNKFGGLSTRDLNNTVAVVHCIYLLQNLARKRARTPKIAAVPTGCAIPAPHSNPTCNGFPPLERSASARPAHHN